MDKDRTELIIGSDPELLLAILGLMTEHTHHSSGIHHKAILTSGFPLGIQCVSLA